jgi:radical SAM protein with 4Fe4S-binding SPASM domain
MITRDLTPAKYEASEMPPRLLMELDARCNLKCPMCLLHGTTAGDGDRTSKMDLSAARSILDQFTANKALIQPAMWGEPTIAKDFRDHVRQMKQRGFTVAINTNGLTFPASLCDFVIDYQVDAVFFSMDAMTPKTFKICRGVDNLEKIADSLHLLLKARQTRASIYPRIGATFTIQKENKHELHYFVSHWITVADLVRTSAVFEGGRLLGIYEPPKRQPCAMLYHTMPIHANGDVSMCCFDSHKNAIMGNVIKDGGVKAVWHGRRFTEARKHHETGEFDKEPFCKNCNAWAGHLYLEEQEELNGVPVLVRRSSQFTYYNRIDRLASWHDGIRGHEPPER